MVGHLMTDYAEIGVECDSTLPHFYFSNVSSSLSPRQREILSLAARGLFSEEIGNEIGITAHTVRLHLQATRRKLGARNTTHAVAIALEKHIIQLEDTP